MHIGTQRVSPYPALTEPTLLPENKRDPIPLDVRQKRAIDSRSPEHQERVLDVRPVDLSPDSGFATANIDIDPATQEITDSFKSVEQEAAHFLKNKFAVFAQKAKTPAEKEQWNIDPDNTFLVTFDYNTTGQRPYPAKVIQRISLTQALIQNAQGTPSGQGYEVPFYAGGPEVIVKPDLKTLRPGTFDLSSRFNPNREQANTTHTFQGIYKESSQEPAPVYNGVNQSSITPAEFKKLIWKADLQQPYKAFLDDFWTRHLDKYPVLAKASFIHSAMAQHQEGSLTSQSRELIMRAAGLSGNQASWPDIKYADLQKNPPNDPNIELGLIKLGSYPSTDLVYLTDTQSTPVLTLLYIPGNSSPIHSFSRQADMKDWLAKQLADPAKRTAMALHFALKDKPNGFARAGIDETLAGLGTWPDKRETPGGLLNYDHRAFTGFWDPQAFITTEPSHLPFDEIAKRQKDRSYADADVQITSDADETKKAVLSALEKSEKVALFLTPLALVMPEVALALDAFYLADGLTTTVIGIDDTVHGKTTGTERIVFGVFNAATVVIPQLARAGKTAEGAAGNVESNTLHLDDKPAPTTPEPSHLQPPVRPRQLPDFSAHAMPENFLEGRTLRGDGTYQVGERFFVRYTDGTDVSRVFEISRNYKIENGYVRVIEPATGKTAMFLESAGNGEWRLNTMKGGGKKTIKPALQKKPLLEDNTVPRASMGQSLINHQDWQSIVDSGTHNDQPVYIHYTDKAGAEAITRGHTINDAARGATREGSKGGVYVNPPGQQFNSENVEDLLFLGNERYVGRGDYMVIFSTDQVPQDLGAITAGSPFVELKMPRDIKLKASNFLYLGPNKFPNYFG